MTRHVMTQSSLNTIFHECRQCGVCCKKYRKIALKRDEVAFIEKMGGYVGVDITLRAIQEKGMQRAKEEAMEQGKIFMIHPDNSGCVFLQHRNNKYYCKIYHYRPQTCRGYKCNMADSTFLSLYNGDAIHLLGQDHYGLPLK